MKKQSLQIGRHTVHERVMAPDKKQPLVLVHGLGVSGDYFLPFAEQMSAFYSLYIIDLPGHGKSTKPRPPLTIDELSHILLDYLTDKNLRNVIVVGQSMGCQIAARAVSYNPALFSKVILLSPTVNKNERRASTQAYRLCQDIWHESSSVAILVLRDYIRMGFKRYLLTAKDMIADHIEDSLTDCLLPTLIVRGEKDKIAPHAWAAYLAHQGMNRTLVEIPNAPHLLHYTKPQELAAICRNFIEN